MESPRPDEAHGTPAGDGESNLRSRVFALYRELARQRADAARREAELEASHRADLHALRKRLAVLALESFHLEAEARALGLEPRIEGSEPGPAERALQNLLARFRETLVTLHVRVDSLDGIELSDALRGEVAVRNSIEGDTDRIRVKTTLRPRVLVDDELVTMAEVITEVPRKG